MLDVDRCVDVDSRRQQLLDVLPALGVAAAGNVAVGQFVDQGQRRRVGEETVEVHFLQFHPSILEAAQRLLRHACEEGLGFRPRVGLDHPGAQFHALAQLGLGGLQHGEGLAHPGAAPRKTFRRPRPSAGRSASSASARAVSVMDRSYSVALRRAGRTIAGDHPPMRRYCKPLRGSLGKPSASTPPAPCSAPAR